MNPFLLTDAYKASHHLMYPERTALVYCNFTPRSNKHAPKGCDSVVSFGQQAMMRFIKGVFDKSFFCIPQTFKLRMAKISNNGKLPKKAQKQLDEYKHAICGEVQAEWSLLLGYDVDVSHIAALWDLGHLPLVVKAIPEGTEVPVGVPVLTLYNTHPSFYWLPNFLETLISNILWKPMTSATIAKVFKGKLKSWALKTDPSNIDFVDFQGHDFSMRGMDSPLAAITSGLGHATSFKGSDSLPAISGARNFYDEKDFVIGSVPATEHSVMCAGSKDGEIETFRRLMSAFPKGILSIVSDTWDLWKVLTEYLPELKDEIMARDGKIVIRPDSGDPVDIICGSLHSKYTKLEGFDPKVDHVLSWVEDNLLEEVREETPHGERGATEHTGYYIAGGKYYKATIHNISWNRYDKQYYFIDMWEEANITLEEMTLKPEDKGVIELLWDTFGGTTNEQGYKVLDSHIGAIYGDSITLDRAEEICSRLEAKGFASTNIVLGIGSFTYQYNTRDTFGFAMKATYCEVMHEVAKEMMSEDDSDTVYAMEGREIFKDPITDDGTKKSAKGLLMVTLDKEGNYILKDQSTWDEEGKGVLQTIFSNGVLKNQTTLTQIREILNK